jgi:hypothetical protein
MSLNENDEERFLRAVNRLNAQTDFVMFAMRPGEWFAIIAALQLASRHPYYRTTIAAGIIRQAVDQIAARLTVDEPELGELIQRGWFCTFDN